VLEIEGLLVGAGAQGQEQGEEVSGKRRRVARFESLSERHIEMTMEEAAAAEGPIQGQGATHSPPRRRRRGRQQHDVQGHEEEEEEEQAVASVQCVGCVIGNRTGVIGDIADCHDCRQGWHRVCASSPGDEGAAAEEQEGEGQPMVCYLCRDENGQRGRR
jgi:hypothetical protein